MGSLALLLGLGLLLLGGKRAPQGVVTVGPARIIKAPVKVKMGLAKIKPAVRVKVGPAKIKPSVTLRMPTSVHDTTKAAVHAAAPRVGPPIPNPAAARKVAQPVADHVRNNRKKYDHGRVSTFQAYAGIKPDGLYGPATAKALRAYGAKNVVG